jgi:hypothetical protein
MASRMLQHYVEDILEVLEGPTKCVQSIGVQRWVVVVKCEKKMHVATATDVTMQQKNQLG